MHGQQSIIWKSDLTDKNETQFLPGSSRIDTAVWMHYMDANKMAGDKARWQLHKNAVSNIEQVLAATPHKTPTIRTPPSHHKNYPSETNQTCWRNRDKLISDVLLWTPTYGRAISSYVRIQDVALKTCQR